MPTFEERLRDAEKEIVKLKVDWVKAQERLDMMFIRLGVYEEKMAMVEYNEKNRERREKHAARAGKGVK